MADTNKIFKSLQDHAENPPPGLYVRLWQKIKLLPKPGKALLNMILAESPTNTRPALKETAQAFADLRSYIDKENPPPAFDLQKIKGALANSSTSRVSAKRPGKLRWLYRSAAAAAIVAGVVWAYKTIDTHKEETVISSNTVQMPVHDTIKREQVAVSREKINITQKNDIKVITARKNTTSYQQKKQVPIAYTNTNSNINIINNDFLFTLTNFTVNEANDVLSVLKKDNKVSVNNYTYVNVSDKMAVFLKQLYAINRRNKYTWKARRTKAKLNRWKKSDEQYFDGTSKDPLDIIDLSEFLLNNKQ